MQPATAQLRACVSRAKELISQNRRGSAAACLRNLDDDELIDLLSPTLSDGDKRSQLNWTDYFAEPFYAAIAIAAISGLIHLYFTYHNSPYADFSLAFCLLLCLFSIVAVGGGHLDDNRRSTPRHVDLAEVPAHELRDADALRDATASPHRGASMRRRQRPTSPSPRRPPQMYPPQHRPPQSAIAAKAAKASVQARSSSAGTRSGRRSASATMRPSVRLTVYRGTSQMSSPISSHPVCR